jgi:hypothetical protein
MVPFCRYDSCPKHESMMIVGNLVNTHNKTKYVKVFSLTFNSVNFNNITFKTFYKL